MRKVFLSAKFVKGMAHAFWFLVGLAAARALVELMNGLPDCGDRAVILAVLGVLLCALAAGRRA